MSTLHITNGDSAASILKSAGVCADIVSWRDCLHEGPVPAGLSLAAMSDVRAHYLANTFALSEAEVRKDFQARDRRLAESLHDAEVILWFEHDLYDQLQLLQILHWFSAQDLTESKLGMICIGEFPGIDAFHGLGQLTPQQMKTLMGTQQPVTSAQLHLGKAGWEAFGSPEPTMLEAYLEQDLSCLPFMRDAVLRHLEEFPSTQNGMSRTEQQILEILKTGPMNPVDLFCASQEREAARYLGDWSFWRIVAQLIDASQPLLSTENGAPFQYPPASAQQGGFREQLIHLTDMGRRVLDAQVDRIACCGLDCWLGGVHLHDGHYWRWCREDRKIYEHVA
ncbi:MAG: DUF1835 domain-containing protein [Pseudomonadota bacterium]